MAFAIPGYEGKLQLAQLGYEIGDGLIVPCNRIIWRSQCEINAITTAAGGCYPNVFPGFNTPALLEIYGPWRNDFNPWNSIPNLQIGQTIQAQLSVYAGTFDAYCPEAIVVESDWITEASVQPIWHLVLCATWQYQGTRTNLKVRDIGGDNE